MSSRTIFAAGGVRRVPATGFLCHAGDHGKAKRSRGPAVGMVLSIFIACVFPSPALSQSCPANGSVGVGGSCFVNDNPNCGVACAGSGGSDDSNACAAGWSATQAAGQTCISDLCCAGGIDTRPAHATCVYDLKGGNDYCCLGGCVGPTGTACQVGQSCHCAGDRPGLTVGAADMCASGLADSSGVCQGLDAGGACTGYDPGCDTNLVCEYTGGIHVCCIPPGSPNHECNGDPQHDPGCCETISGLEVGCNGGICCNNAGGNCSVDTDCCNGNVCSNGKCAIDANQGVCTTGSDCLSTLCSSGTCLCDALGTNVIGNWWECCSADCGGGQNCVHNSTFDAGCINNSPCSSLTQICDTNVHACKITSSGSAYEPCSPTTPNQCTTHPITLTCQSNGACCNTQGGPCATNQDCCPGSSCNNSGTCEYHGTEFYSCTGSSQCLFGCDPSTHKCF